MRIVRVGVPAPLLDLALTVIFVFMALFLLSNLNDPKKNADGGKITPKAEFMISLDWTSESSDDLDLWVKNPLGQVISFRHRETPGMFLDRDDLGISNDAVTTENGELKVISLNRELVTIRAIIPGTYIVAVHLYKRHETILKNEATIILTKLNPYSEVRMITNTMYIEGQELTFMTFTVNNDGTVSGISLEQNPFILEDMTTTNVPRTEP